MDQKQLLRLKEQVDEAKSAVSELKGQQKALMNQLKEEWKCDTVEKAEKKLDSMTEQITEFEDKIEDGVAELKEKHNITEEED